MGDGRARGSTGGSPNSFKRPLLQGIAEAGLELCWLYATALFFFRVGNLSPLPPLAALLPFLAAVLPRAISRERGWRVYQVGFLYLSALAVALLASFYSFGRWSADLPLTDLHWVGRVVGAASGDTLAFLTLFLFCLAFWWSGLAFAGRSPSGEAATRRFDLGVALFAAVVVLGALVHRTSPELHLLIPSFFLFSVLAIALARSRGSGRRFFAEGSRGAGIFVSFALAAMVLGLALLPLLRVFQDAARRGYSAVQAAAASIWPSLLALLRLLFGLWKARTPAPDYSVPDQHTSHLAAHLAQHDSGLLGLILTWSMIGLAGLAALAFLGYALWRLVRYLGSRTPDGRMRGRTSGLALLLRAILSGARAVHALLSRILRREPARHGMGMASFRFLTRWGRRSGVSRLARETPLQYGLRLSGRFPELAIPIAGIVEGFAEELYGETSLAPARGAKLRSSCRKLARPNLWLARARSRLSPLREEHLEEKRPIRLPL